MYEVDITFKTNDFATVDVDADDKDQAEFLAIGRLKEMYDDVTDVDIVEIREV